MKPFRLITRTILGVATALLSLAGCSPVRHVPAGQYLLDRAEISVQGAPTEDVNPSQLINFLRQRPNHKTLGLFPLPLAMYSMSGSDTARWYNRWLRNMGQPPVIYDSTLTSISALQLRQALVNKGYTDAIVELDTVLDSRRRRASVDYNIQPGNPHYIGRLTLDVDHAPLRSVIEADPAMDAVAPGALFDRARLDNLRSILTHTLRDAGYYAFRREEITFTADTASGSKAVGLTMHVRSANTASRCIHIIKSVTFVTEEALQTAHPDTVKYQDISVIYGDDHYLKPSALYDMCYLEPGMTYNSGAIERTYASLSRLPILRFINIELIPAGTAGNLGLLEARITIARNRRQSMSVELEGTNSEGDLGCGIGATYQNRNLWRRSEMLTVKLRTSYESLSGNLDGLINKRYTEYAGEASLTFPKFELPFASRAFKKRMRATTDLSLSANYQERPEYTRYIVGAAWRWKWNTRRAEYNSRHTYDLVDINIVRLPHSTIDFIDDIAPDNPLLRYSYEDHFIMRMGYNYYHTNKRLPGADRSGFAIQPYVTTLRTGVETAGNLLYGLSNLLDESRRGGVYKVFGVQYAQYVKGEFDYTYTRNFNSRNALAFHVGAGLAYPYGNSSMVPFEKRFFAGGANGVRGWGVRTLGPGGYDSRNSVTDFINQCGDISMIMSVEYRAKLFWVLEGALFVDAGNIWTIHNYPNQPEGLWQFDKFYRQIAASYGVGLRMDFSYFLLRLDLGLKAHNPATNQEPWPLLHPRWGRDANFHFSVGYPF